MQKKVLYFQTKFLAEKKADSITITGFGSTGDLDRYNDKVLPTAFEDSLPTFMKNPVMLLQHDDNKVIGKFTSTEIKGNGLQVTWEVMYDIDGCMKKIEDGVLGAFSIGFITQAYQYEDDAGHILYKSDEGLMAGYSWDDLYTDKVVRVITKLDLVEISVVSTPANPYALFQVAKDFFINETKSLKALAMQMKGAPNEVTETVETTEEVTTEANQEATEAVQTPETQIDPNTTTEEVKSSENLESNEEQTPGVTTAEEEGKSEDVKAVENPTETTPSGISEEKAKDLIKEELNLVVKELTIAFEAKLKTLAEENTKVSKALEESETKYAKLEKELLNIEVPKRTTDTVKSVLTKPITDADILRTIGMV